jgi:hypothetical protein
MAGYPGENRVFENFVSLVSKRASTAFECWSGKFVQREFNLNGTRMTAKLFFDDPCLRARKQKKRTRFQVRFYSVNAT